MVSVIIPTHNRRAQLTRAVDSVLAQTHRELEVIVVDDGSTDDTPELMAERFGADPRVAYVRQKRTGVAGARNTGIDRAQGDLVAFLDSDDSWLPWKLALQLACLERVPAAGMIWTEMHATNADGEVIPGSSLADILPFRFPLDELFAERTALPEVAGAPATLADRHLYVGDIYGKMIIGNLVLPSSAVMTRARLDRVQRFDESLHVAGEDFDFFLRTCREGPVAFIDAPSVLHAVGGADQLTHSSRALHLARNYLRTMDAALVRDAARVDLPADRVRAAQASGNAWAGQAYLESGQPRAARRHLREALRIDPTCKRALLLAPFALLPGKLGAWTFRTLRRVRVLYRRRRQRQS